MSMSLMVAAMKSKVGSPTRKLVLLKLADNANDKGECWPSYQHIADQCELSKRSVISHIHQLEKDGFLTIEHRIKDGTMNQSNVFRLTICDKKQNGFSGEDSALGSENSALGVVKNLHHPSENSALGGSEKFAPRTSHSLEPVIESIDKRTFSPPTVDQIHEVMREKGCDSKVEALKFFNFYESKGWVVGNHKMKNWKAACNGWLLRNSEKVKLDGNTKPMSLVDRVRINAERREAERAISEGYGSVLAADDGNVRP